MMRQLLFLSVLYVGESFLQQQQTRTVQRLAEKNSVVQRQMLPDATLEVLRLVAAVPTLYALMSVNEYVTHRYYQHAEFNKGPRTTLRSLGLAVPKVSGGGHVEHHAETLDDMTLKTDKAWRSTSVAKVLDEDPYRGTAFSWSVSGIMTLQMIPTAIPALALLGFTIPQSFLLLAPAMLLHALVWNAIHPWMHALPDVPLAFGAPSSLFSAIRNKAPYFRFLYLNHQGHHVLGGRANFNVACPGADHLFGSFVPEAVWRPQMKSSFESHHSSRGDSLSVSAADQARLAAAQVSSAAV